MVACPYLARDLLGVSCSQRRQADPEHARSLPQGLGLRPGQAGGDQPGIGRPELRQPREVSGTRGGLKLVECIHQDNHAAALGRAAQQ